MAPILELASRALARSLPQDDIGTSLDGSDSYLGPSDNTTSPTQTSAVRLSTGASIAIAVVFVLLMVSIIVTICVCVNRSKRTTREAKESKEVEMGNTFGDEDSTMGIVKGEMKKPTKIWAPWRR